MEMGDCGIITGIVFFADLWKSFDTLDYDIIFKHYHFDMRVKMIS